MYVNSVLFFKSKLVVVPLLCCLLCGYTSIVSLLACTYVYNRMCMFATVYSGTWQEMPDFLAEVPGSVERNGDLA